jgi:hypothetical protein
VTLVHALKIVLCGLLLTSCASTQPEALQGAPAWAGTLSERHSPITESESNGLRVMRLPPREGTFEAAILFSGGPLLDPPDRPGLTEWTVRTAVLGTEGDREEDRGPEARALALGVTLVPVSNGNIFGWVALGPSASEEAAVELLADLARRPSFPATSMQILGARERQRIEASGDEALNAMLAVAIGFALGLNRPLHLEPPVTLFDVLVREDAVRHWRRWFRPSRAVFLTTAGGELSRAWSQWGEPEPAPSVQSACTPHGRTAHHLFDADRDADDVIALFAAAIPGLGSTARRSVGAWFTALSERPRGPVAGAVGLEQARRASPSIVDLATGPGASLSVALSGTRGDRERALEDLLQVARLWLPKTTAIDTGSVSGSLVYMAGDRRVRSEQPIARCIVFAEEALYGHAGLPTGAEALASVRGLLEPWRYTFVALGPSDLTPALEEIAPVYRWDSTGQEQGGVKRTRCEHSPDG